MEPTSIHSPLPRLRPARPVVGVMLAREPLLDVGAATVDREVAVHTLVRAAERVNRLGCEWWFVGLLVSVFAAAVGRGLCG